MCDVQFSLQHKRELVLIVLFVEMLIYPDRLFYLYFLE